MSAVRMDGKALSAKVRGSILAETEELKKKGVTPGLAVIIVGNDPASEIYVRNKERACEQCGFYSEKYALPEETSQEELLGLIAQLNESPQISGILCQMPVPKHISEQAVIDAIDPRKDVDAFHPVNVGKIMVGNFDFVPCTPAGVMELLDEYQIDPRGKECVVVGRSNIVGKPMAMLLLHRHGTVTRRISLRSAAARIFWSRPSARPASSPRIWSRRVRSSSTSASTATPRARSAATLRPR